MKRHQNAKRLALVVGLGITALSTAKAQLPDMALAAKWEKATTIHYEAIGEVSARHVQIPPSTPTCTPT